MAEQQTAPQPNPRVDPSFIGVIKQRERIKGKLQNIKHKIGIYSAKGGVGKTTVAVNIAYALNSKGFKVGLLDADVDCPNLTLFLGIDEHITSGPQIKPIEKGGVKVVSTAMFADSITQPIIWRGPIINKMLGEFFENTEWGDLDYLIIDLPPGTSDSPLTIMQLLDLEGIILVTTPQRIAAINTIRSGLMAKKLSVAVLGVIENMSDGSGTAAKAVAEAIGCENFGIIKSDAKFGAFSDAGKVPILEDKEIKEEFINIISKFSIK